MILFMLLCHLPLISSQNEPWKIVTVETCDAGCNFTEGIITSESIKKWPSSCEKVCGDLRINSQTDLSESQLNSSFYNLKTLYGKLAIEYTNYKSLNFLPSLKAIYFMVIIGYNTELTNITTFWKWEGVTPFVWHIVGNSKLNFEPFCDRQIYSPNIDYNVYSNLKNCDCKNARIGPNSLAHFPNCTTITSGGLKFHRVNGSMNLKPLSFLKKLNGYLRVYETDLEDISFLKNLKTIEFQYTGEYYVDIYGNPNLKRLGLGSLKKSLPVDGLPWVNLTNNHPDFCISTNELQAFAEAKAQFFNLQAKLCPDLIRKDKQKVCNFDDLSTMDSNCQHIIGDVIINSDNEEHLSKLEKVTHIYGTLTIEGTEKLTDLGFLANFRQVTNLRMDKIPMIRINSNKKLQKFWLPNMKTPPFPNGFDQIIEIDGNSQDIFRDRRECLLFQKLIQTTTKYNKKSCTKLPTAVTTQKEPTILATTPVVFDLISTKSYESGLNFTTIPASSDIPESTTLFAEPETTMKSGYSADSRIFSFSLIFAVWFLFH